MENNNFNNTNNYLTQNLPEPRLSGSGHINVGRSERIASVAGGLALTFLGFRKFNPAHFMATLGGGYLLYRGLSGHCLVNEALEIDNSGSKSSPVIIRRSITINKPRAEVFARWRDFENLPQILQHLSEIKVTDEGRKRYHWVMKLPKGLGHLEWDAEITEEKQNELLVFRTYNGSDVSQSGQVEFLEVPDGRGTEMRAIIRYYPPAGYIGISAAKALNGYISDLVLADMNRFKQLLENGEIKRKND